MLLPKIIIYFIIVTIPLLFAAVQPWAWSVYSVLIFAAFLHLLWQGKNQPSWVPNNIVIFSVVVFFVVTLNQFVGQVQMARSPHDSAAGTIVDHGVTL